MSGLLQRWVRLDRSRTQRFARACCSAVLLGQKLGQSIQPSSESLSTFLQVCQAFWHELETFPSKGLTFSKHLKLFPEEVELYDCLFEPTRLSYLPGYHTYCWS